MQLAGASSLRLTWLAGLAAIPLLAVIWSPTPAHAASFNYPDFKSTNGLTLNGDAKPTRNVIHVVPNEPGQTGSIFRTTPAVDPTESFKTRFRAKIQKHAFGDGMAFVLQDDAAGATALGGGGGGMGYQGIQPSLVVEMDIHYNAGADPVSANHIAVHEDGDPTAYEMAVEAPFQIQGRPFSIWINYSAADQELKVYAQQRNRKPDEPLITYNRDLGDLLGEDEVFGGFTAATGFEFGAHNLKSWKLTQ